jgi:hypothetical protein
MAKKSREGVKQWMYCKKKSLPIRYLHYLQIKQLPLAGFTKILLVFNWWKAVCPERPAA